MDTHTDTPLRDQLVRMRIPTNVERRGGGGGLQTVSTSFNIRETKEMLNGCGSKV